jgi:hypothetical protein
LQSLALSGRRLALESGQRVRLYRAAQAQILDEPNGASRIDSAEAQGRCDFRVRIIFGEHPPGKIDIRLQNVVCHDRAG